MVLAQGSEGTSAILSLVCLVGGPSRGFQITWSKSASLRAPQQVFPRRPKHCRMVAAANLGSTCYIPVASHPSAVTDRALGTLPNVCLWGQNLPWQRGAGGIKTTALPDLCCPLIPPLS